MLAQAKASACHLPDAAYRRHQPFCIPYNADPGIRERRIYSRLDSIEKLWGVLKINAKCRS